MRTIYRQLGRWIALGMGAGCSSAAPPMTTATPARTAEVEQSIQQSFDRLRALNVVDVGGLVLDLPAEATSCYGRPCPGSGFEEPYLAERARQAPRLERLTGVAEDVVRDPNLAQHDESEASQALQALSGLAIVEVAGLVETKPANNPQCYNLPCSSDIEAAHRENSARVSQVFAIVTRAKEGGL